MKHRPLNCGSPLTAEILGSQGAEIQQANLLRLSFDAIIVWQSGGGIESWNRGAEMLYGFTEREAIGQRLNDLLKPVFPVSHSESRRC
jgi:PAS domain S-box-containing protein